MAASTRGPNLGRILKTGEYSDVTLVCSGKEFNVHKAVVCSQSEVLAAAIREPFQESSTGSIVIEEFSVATVERMLEFLYTGDYSPWHEAEDVNDDGSLTNSAEPEDELFQHVHMNAIADYYDIKELADLSKAKLRNASQNTSNETSLLNAAKEALSSTGDTTLHDMLAEVTADNVKRYLETEQLSELVGRFGVVILRKVTALEGELRAKIMDLQIERNSAERRSAQIVENINKCLGTLKERHECRNLNCRADFNCYIEQRGQSSAPCFTLRCCQCQCRH